MDGAWTLKQVQERGQIWPDILLLHRPEQFENAMQVVQYRHNLPQDQCTLVLQDLYNHYTGKLSPEEVDQLLLDSVDHQEADMPAIMSVVFQCAASYGAYPYFFVALSRAHAQKEAGC